MATTEQVAMLRAAGWVNNAHSPVRWQNLDISECWLPEEVALHIETLRLRVEELEAFDARKDERGLSPFVFD